MRGADGMFPEYNPEMEAFEGEQFAYEAPWSGEVFSEAELMELAAELLEVRDEAELDLFLGNLIKRAGKAIRQVVKSPVGKAIGGILKGAAKQALPIAGTAVGAHSVACWGRQSAVESLRRPTMLWASSWKA